MGETRVGHVHGEVIGARSTFNGCGHIPMKKTLRRLGAFLNVLFYSVFKPLEPISMRSLILSMLLCSRAASTQVCSVYTSARTRELHRKQAHVPPIETNTFYAVLLHPRFYAVVLSTGRPPTSTPHTYGATTLVFHLAVISLLLKIVVVVVVIIVQLIAGVLGCFGKVDCFTTCAPAVADYIVRVDFLHVVLIFFFFFGWDRTNISSTPDMWKGRCYWAYALPSTARVMRQRGSLEWQSIGSVGGHTSSSAPVSSSELLSSSPMLTS